METILKAVSMCEFMQEMRMIAKNGGIGKGWPPQIFQRKAKVKMKKQKKKKKEKKIKKLRNICEKLI